MAKRTKSKKEKKDKQPTYPPSAAMRRKQEEEQAEKERLQQERANKRKKKVVPASPLTDSGTGNAGMLGAANTADDAEINELAEDGAEKKVLGMGERDVDGDGDVKMRDVKPDDDQPLPSPEHTVLDNLIARFEDSVNKENLFRKSLAKSPHSMQVVLVALSQERDTIAMEMKDVYVKLGVESRDVQRI